MARARVELNRTAVRQLLRGPEIRADLERRGQRVAAVAGPGHEAQTWIGRNRVRVTVATTTREAAVREARTRALLTALEAGR